MADVGCPVYAAVAAWELETWLLQWPEVLGAYRASIVDSSIR